MTFQEFVDSYFGWHIDICELSEEDEAMLAEMYAKEEM